MLWFGAAIALFVILAGLAWRIDDLTDRVKKLEDAR